MAASKTLGRTKPVTGDVLVGKDLTRTRAYTLSVVPGPPQLRCSTYDEALSTANTWAALGRVSIWVTHDGQTLTPVALAKHLPSGGAPTRSLNPPEY